MVKCIVGDIFKQMYEACVVLKKGKEEVAVQEEKGKFGTALKVKTVGEKLKQKERVKFGSKVLRWECDGTHGLLRNADGGQKGYQCFFDFFT
jgi:hypothetical protein